jgi:carbamoyl-phosphate synthase small subunit
MFLKPNETLAALVALEDGRVFECRSFTGHGEASGEIVFNTGMTGYQEILTDPSYSGQMVVMTYPLIGNYGVNPEDMESDGVHAEALIVKEYQADPSNHRASETLADFLRRHGKMGIEGLDTRALTRHIRTAGAMRAFVSTENLDPRSCAQKARAIAPMAGRDLDTPHQRSNPIGGSMEEKYSFLLRRPVSARGSGRRKAKSRRWPPSTMASNTTFCAASKEQVLR